MTSKPQEASPYVNPFLNILFYAPDPGPVIRKVRTYLQDPSGFSRNVIVTPPSNLIWAIDSDTNIPFSEMILNNEDFISSHILIIPEDSKSTDRSRRMATFNNKAVFIYKNYIQTNAGFKAHFNSKILNEYIITPFSPYLPEDSQFLVYDVSYPLVGRPTFPNLNQLPLTQSQSGTNPLGIPYPSSSHTPTNLHFFEEKSQQQKLDSNLLDSPEYFGVDLEKIKSEMKVKEDYKLLPVVYTKEIAKADMELLHIINTFSADSAKTKDDLIGLYNDTIDQAISSFSAIGPTTINKIMNETGLSTQDLGKMVGEHVESQIHQQLWEKTLQFHQKEDADISDLCWGMKYIGVEQLGIPVDDMTTLFDLDDLVAQAVKLFSSLTTVIGAKDKSKILLSVIQILSNGTPDAADKEALQRATKCSVHYNLELNSDSTYSKLKNVISADVLVSLMILVVVRSDMVNINSLLFYIRNFSFNDVEMGHLGYALSTLEAVAYHISNNHHKMTVLSKLNKRFWECLSSIDDTHSFIEDLKKSQPQSWKSIVRSRSPSGVTALVSAIQDVAKLGIATEPDLLNYLFNLTDSEENEVFDVNFVIADRDNGGFSLFLLALDTEDQDFIFSVLSKIDPLNDEQMAKYFLRVNNWKRSVGHYIYHAHWLISEIGPLIDWEVKDLAGQTPLFALFRCYDHQNYGELVELSFKAWATKFQKENPGKSLNLMIHRDPKDNTLLHIVKEKKAIEMLLKFDADVNWPNDLGFTPLMVFSKFSRLEAIKTILTDPLVDIYLQGEGGTNALEVAKEADTIKYLESTFTFMVNFF